MIALISLAATLAIGTTIEEVLSVMPVAVYRGASEDPCTVSRYALAKQGAVTPLTTAAVTLACPLTWNPT